MEWRRVWNLWWAAVCALVAGLHALRAIEHVPVTLGSMSVPMWLSWTVAAVAAVLSLGSVAASDPLPADPKLRALYLERRDLERPDPGLGRTR